MSGPDTFIGRDEHGEAMHSAGTLETVAGWLIALAGCALWGIVIAAWVKS